ncbi:reverse transcriptase domain-containing protein, partial [Tanacetum coccineum]
MPTNIRIYDGSIDPDGHISRFVGAANQGEWDMPVWYRMFQQTLDGPARGWFDRLPNGGIDSWADLREKFVERFALRRRCSKDPTEVSKIVRKVNEMLPSFKEHWTEEMGYVQGVPEVIQISSFMSNSKARSWQDVSPIRPKEILATELQLQLPPPPSLIGAPKRENLDKYCDYHGEKGHYTNDCFQLKRQLEAALESGKLNYLVKDVRQRGGNQGKQTENSSANGKIINMVYERGNSQKRKFHKRREEDWMNVPITFPPIPSNDVSDEPLIIEAGVEGYLVRRVFMD